MYLGYNFVLDKLMHFHQYLVNCKESDKGRLNGKLRYVDATLAGNYRVHQIIILTIKFKNIIIKLDLSNEYFCCVLLRLYTNEENGVQNEAIV